MINQPSRIMFKFNLFLFAYLCISSLASFLFEPQSKEQVPWDTVYKAAPVLSILIAIFIVFLLILWGAKLFELFWNRLMSDLFKLREIDFQEALSMVLVLSIVAAFL